MREGDTFVVPKLDRRARSVPDARAIADQLEANLRRERQAEGIAAAKQRGVYRGRPSKIDMEAIRDLIAKGMSPTEIAQTLGISRGRVDKAKASK